MQKRPQDLTEAQLQYYADVSRNIAARILLDDRRLCTLDLDKVQDKAQVAVQRLGPIAAKGRYR
jgi:hypothetical protein